MSEDSNYKYKAHDAAIEFVEEYLLEQIAEKLMDSGKASDDLYNDYSGADAYHHENHVDKHYEFKDAALAISQLGDYEESDSGLWDGQDMRQALCSCAAWTFGNAVMQMTIDIIGQINEHYDDVLEDQQNSQNEDDEELEALSKEDTLAAIQLICETEQGAYE